MQNQIESLWDGWVKQVKYTRHNADGHCALGWVDDQVSSFAAEGIPWVQEIYHRVAAGIEERYPEYASNFEDAHRVWAKTSDAAAYIDTIIIAYANNVIGITPEGFRQIDRETQMEELQKVIDSIEPFPEAPERLPEPEEEEVFV